MLDNRKIALMTRLALFEKTTGKKDIRLAKYYRFDYIRFQMLKTFFCVTIALGMILGMLAAYKVEYFLKQAAQMQYERFGFLLLVIYLLVLIISEIVTAVLASYDIRLSRKRLGKYYNHLRALRKYYKEEV